MYMIQGLAQSWNCLERRGQSLAREGQSNRCNKKRLKELLNADVFKKRLDLWKTTSLQVLIIAQSIFNNVLRGDPELQLRMVLHHNVNQQSRLNSVAHFLNIYLFFLKSRWHSKHNRKTK